MSANDRQMHSTTFCLAVLLFISLSFAAFPSPVGYVNDFANVLNASQRIELGILLSEIERNTTAEIAVVTVDTAPDIYTYAVDLFEEWKIGKASNDNGLLILYAKEQNKIQVITGYGVEGILPDGKVGRILDEQYVTLRDAGRVADGIIGATRALADVIYANADEVRAGRASAMPSWLPMALSVAFPLFFIFIIVVIIAASRPPKCPADGSRMKKISVERSMTFGGPLEIVHYECPKCGRKITKRRHFFVAAAGYHGGGGGFGGGGTGGGGTGR